MKRLSIITINYNNLQGLKKTVASVVGQTWKEFEYIVIDGGSTDGSAVYIADHKEHFDYWVSEPDLGIYNAMNKGIVKASGEYLLFLNSGDHFYDLDVLKKNLNNIELKDIIYFDLHFYGDDSSYIEKYPDRLSFSFFLHASLPHPATLIRSSLFKQFGYYDESLKIVSDWKFFIETICKHNCSYIKINDVLTTFHLDGISSDTKNKPLILNERNKVLNEEFAMFIDDINEFNYLRGLVSQLKKSRKIGWLIKLGMLDKF